MAAGLGSPAEHALISLLALNGLRVSEATGADIEHLGLERGHRTLTITRKGGKVVTIPLVPRTAGAIDLATGGRCDGPIFVTGDGRRLDRHGAGIGIDIPAFQAYILSIEYVICSSRYAVPVRGRTAPECPSGTACSPSSSSPSSPWRQETEITAEASPCSDTWKRGDLVRMTPARRVTLAICVPVAIAAIGWGVFNVVALADAGRYSFSMPLTVSGGQLAADFPGSNVTVVPGDAARLAGTVSYSLVRPHLTVNDGKVSYPCAIPAGECGMTATLTVPPSATSVNVSTGGGSLTVPRGVIGKVTLTTSGSNITANGLAGTANLDSGSGAINVSGITASDVTVNTYGGNAALTFTKTPRDVQVTSASGAVSIALPHGSYDFRVSAGGGDVRTPASDPAAHDVITVNSAGGIVTVSKS